MTTLNKIIILLLLITLFSCKPEIKYPRYVLETFSYVPDSLKPKHQRWIIETVKAASQNMTTSDYEDVSETIEDTKDVADRIFEIEEIGLRKEFNDDMYRTIHLKLSQLSKQELKILDSLKNQ